MGEKSMIEVLDAAKYKFVGARPILGEGRPLLPRERIFISSLIDPADPRNLAQRALDEGVMSAGPIRFMIRFADGREAGVMLYPTA